MNTQSSPIFLISRIARVLAFLAALALLPGGALILPNCLAQNPTVVDAEAFRIQAEMHHDLALHYLNKGEVDRAIAEARQILQPRIPTQLEEAVCKSMMFVAEKLGSMQRFDLAQTILDESFKAMTQVSGRILLLKDKSRLFYLAGESDKAVDALKRAKDLEARRR